MESTINYLPIEILFIIFRFVDLKTLLNAQCVCHLWHKLVSQLLCSYKEVIIQDFLPRRLNDRCGNFNLVGLHKRRKLFTVNLNDFSGYRIHKKIFIGRIISKFKSLQVIYLCLMNGTESECNLLDMITDNCNSDIKRLTFISRRKAYLGAYEVNRFCKKFKNLKHFQFEATELDVCAIGIAFLLRNLPKLETFIILDCIHTYERKLQVLGCPNDCIPYCKDDCPKDFFNGVSDTIRVIKVSGDVMGENTIACIPDSKMRQLVNLHICNLDGIRSLQMIANKFLSLKSLTISSSFTLSNRGQGDALMLSLSRLVNLIKLHMFIETHNCIFTYNSFYLLKSCTKLTSLQIESTYLNCDCVEAISRSLPQLNKLDMTYIIFEEGCEESIGWITRLKNLQCLKLSASPELEDESIIPIIDRCDELSYMDFSRSELLAEQTYKACHRLALRHPNRRITIYFAQRNQINIKALIVTEFKNIIPNNMVIKFPTIKYI